MPAMPQPHKRTDLRTGYNNGFKAKNFDTRIGPITLRPSGPRRA
jgi:hypothetical protein